MYECVEVSKTSVVTEFEHTARCQQLKWSTARCDWWSRCIKHQLIESACWLNISNIFHAFTNVLMSYTYSINTGDMQASHRTQSILLTRRSCVLGGANGLPWSCLWGPHSSGSVPAGARCQHWGQGWCALSFIVMKIILYIVSHKLMSKLAWFLLKSPRWLDFLKNITCLTLIRLTNLVTQIIISLVTT